MENNNSKFRLYQPEGEIFIVSHTSEESNKFTSWAILEYLLTEDNHVRLWFIYTLPKYRRNGYASELLKKLQDSHNKITTHVVSINGEGETLCLKNGFELKKSIHKNKIDEIVWEKK